MAIKKENKKMKTLQLLTPIYINGAFKLISVNGYQINERMALLNEKEMNKVGILTNRHKWRICYKVKNNVYLKAREYDTRKQALESVEELEIKILHFLAINLNEVKIAKLISEMEYYK